MTSVRTTDKAVTWLVALLVGLIAGYASVRLQGGTCSPQAAGISPAPMRDQSSARAASPSASVPAARVSVARREPSASGTGTPAPRLHSPTEPLAGPADAAPSPRAPLAAAGTATAISGRDRAQATRAPKNDRLGLLVDAVAAAIRAEHALVQKANTLAGLSGQPSARATTQSSAPQRSVSSAPPSPARAALASTGSASRTLARVGPLYRVTSGPIYDRELAAAIVAQLIHVGFTPMLSADPQGEPESYRVASESLLLSVAGHRAAGLIDLHPDQEVLANGRVRLRFGVFAAEQEAQDLAERIRARGYFAAAERAGGTAYTITLSPARRSAADATVAIIKANGTELRIRVDVVP